MPLPDNAWANRTVDGTPDYDEIIFWQPDDSDASEGETTKLSITTTKIVEDAFACSMVNEKRRSLKRKQPVPDTHIKCPKLDSTIQSRLPKSAKDANCASARIQTLVGAPLINILESARKGTLNTKEAAESAQQALKLLGNASANISMERKRNATQYLNTELVTMVDNEQSFKDAAPLLFRKTFDQRARDHIDTVKSLKKTSYYKGQPFQRHHPGEVATVAEAENQHSGNPASRQRKKHNDYSWYKKFNKCIEPYNQHMQKRKRSSKYGSKHSTGSHGARGCTKGHEAAFDDSGGLDHLD